MNPDDNKPIEPVTPGSGAQPGSVTTEPVTTDAPAPAAKCVKCGGDSEDGNCKMCQTTEGECTCPPAPAPTEEEPAGVPA